MKLSLSGEVGPVHPKVIWAGAVTLSFGVVVYEIEKYSHYRFDGTETAFLTAILGIGVGYFKRAPTPRPQVRVVTVPVTAPSLVPFTEPSVEPDEPEYVIEDKPPPAVSERQEHGFTSAPRTAEWGKTA